MKRLFILCAALSSLVQATDSIRTSTTGFYPVWENTGHVERNGNVRIGLADVEAGLANKVQIGANPILFAYRVPNAYLKVDLGKTGLMQWSVQAGFYYLLEQASRSSFSPMYVSRLDNPNFTLFLVPVNLNNTLSLSDWVQVHQSFTLLPSFSSSRVENKVYGGYSVVAELLPESRHGLLFHFTEIGIWDHDQAILGGSYRYRNTWMEFRLGYFYRMQKVGVQSSPLVGLTFLL